VQSTLGSRAALFGNDSMLVTITLSMQRTDVLAPVTFSYGLSTVRRALLLDIESPRYPRLALTA